MLESRVASTSSSSCAYPGSHSQPSVEPDTAEDFFSDLAARRKRLHSLDKSSDVSVYMKDASDSISSLSKYPSLKQLYIELNSTLPALSAAVERLFSLGGKLFQGC